LTRGYTLDGLQAARGIRLSVDHETWNPKFDVWLRRGAEESETAIATDVIRGFKRTWGHGIPVVATAGWDNRTGLMTFTHSGSVIEKPSCTPPAPLPPTFDESQVYVLFPPYLSQHLDVLEANKWGTYWSWYSLWNAARRNQNPCGEPSEFATNPLPRPATLYGLSCVFEFANAIASFSGFEGGPDATWGSEGDWAQSLFYAAAGKVWTLRVYEEGNPANVEQRTYTAAETAQILAGTYTGSEYTAGADGGDIELWLPLPVRYYNERSNRFVFEISASDGTTYPPHTVTLNYHELDLTLLECVRTQKIFRRPLVNWTKGTAPSDIQPAGLDDYAWAIDAGIGKGLTFGKTQRQVESWRAEKRGDLLQMRIRNQKGYSALHGVRLDAQTGRRAAGSRLA
jgi:hypothetical protein